MDIKVKPEKIIGKMKPMHCVGGGPDEYHPYIVDDAKAIFREIGVPACRLHDVKAPYGSNQYVDIHCIFPDFDADEELEESGQKLQASSCKINKFKEHNVQQDDYS